MVEGDSAVQLVLKDILGSLLPIIMAVRGSRTVGRG